MPPGITPGISRHHIIHIQALQTVAELFILQHKVPGTALVDVPRSTTVVDQPFRNPGEDVISVVALDGLEQIFPELFVLDFVMVGILFVLVDGPPFRILGTGRHMASIGIVLHVGLDQI
uniref:(northern house mosquito) hypothetical protein n=1 Tax=Culex pipiens TaxID=7175 RepID=A0A8D8CBX5_CULPI